MLHVVAIPLRNQADLPPNAISVLRECDYLICEEVRVAQTLLKKLSIEKECLPLNEHNQFQVEEEYLAYLKQGKKLALISDCGTPAVCDPGYYLVQLAHSSKIKVSPISGPCSITAALSVCGFDVSKFFFAGFPSRDKDERFTDLKSWANSKVPVVIMDAPFRLNQLLEAAVKTFGKKREACLCVDISGKYEKTLRASLDEIQKDALRLKQKLPFVLIIAS